MPPDSVLAQAILATARTVNPAAEFRCRALLERAATGRELQAALQCELARAGLTESGFAVLAVLLTRDRQPVPRSEIGLAIDLPPAGVADALTRLELSSLVQRHRDETNRRLVWLRLTPEGHERITAGLRRYVTAAVQVTASLAPHELETSVAISRKLRAGAAQLADEGPQLSVA